jgi:hypothetical protein
VRELIGTLNHIVKIMAVPQENSGQVKTADENEVKVLLKIADKLSIWLESAPDDKGMKSWSNLPERGHKAAIESLCLLQDNIDLLLRCKYSFGPMNSECEQAISNLNSLLSGMRMNNEPPEQIEERFGWGDQFALPGFISELRRWAEKLEDERGARKQREQKEPMSKPLSMTKWALVFEVSRRTVVQWKQEKKYPFDRVSERKWRLPLSSLPAEYLHKYQQNQNS